jgi:hypothetical protein
MPAVLLLQAARGAGPPRPPPMHSRHQNLPEASQGDHKMYLTHLEQVCSCLGLQAGAAMPTALLVLLVLNAYALIDQQLQQSTINHSMLNSTTTCGARNSTRTPSPSCFAQVGLCQPTGGLAAPLAPRHCNQRTKLYSFEMWFAFATALQTTRVQTTPASQISQIMLF